MVSDVELEHLISVRSQQGLTDTYTGTGIGTGAGTNTELDVAKRGTVNSIRVAISELVPVPESAAATPGLIDASPSTAAPSPTTARSPAPVLVNAAAAGTGAVPVPVPAPVPVTWSSFRTCSFLLTPPHFPAIKAFGTLIIIMTMCYRNSTQINTATQQKNKQNEQETRRTREEQEKRATTERTNTSRSTIPRESHAHKVVMSPVCAYICRVCYVLLLLLTFSCACCVLCLMCCDCVVVVVFVLLLLCCSM